MANIKVSEMPETTAANIDDLIMIIQGGGNKKITEKNLLGDRVVVSPTEPTGDNRKKVWMQKGKNKFNPNDKTNGYLNINGSFTSATDWTCSGFIEINSNKYILSANATATRVIWCEYDGSMNIIGTRHEVAYGNPIAIVSVNTKYIRVCFNDGTATDIQLEQGTTATTYEPYVEDKIYIKNNNDVYEEFIEKNGEIILYENQNGNNGYEIELFDTVEKYTEVEIYGIGANNERIYQKIINPNSSTFEMSLELMYEGTEYITKALCSFIDNKFYKYQDREYKIVISSANARTVELISWLKITKIVGILN